MELDLEKALIDMLTPFFVTNHFAWSIDGKQFRRATKAGFQCVFLSLIKPLPMVAEIKLGIRIDAVESLVYQFTTGLAMHQYQSNTFIASLGEILEEPYLRYEVAKEAEIQAVAEKIENFMTKTGFHFLKGHDDIYKLEKTFNKNPDKKWTYAYNDYHRCLRGIVLAKITGNREFISLIATYRRRLVKQGTATKLIEKYDKLAAFLKNFSFN